MTHKRI